jgi:hypothetical protein
VLIGRVGERRSFGNPISKEGCPLFCLLALRLFVKKYRARVCAATVSLAAFFAHLSSTTSCHTLHTPLPPGVKLDVEQFLNVAAAPGRMDDMRHCEEM